MEESVGTDHPLRPLVQAWVSKIKVAFDTKKRQFQDDADEAMRFFNGPYDWIYDVKNARDKGAFTFVGNSENEMPRLSFAMTVNKAAELVQLFGPALYHRNPVRTVTPRQYWAPPPEMLGDPNDPTVMAYLQQMTQQVTGTRQEDQARAALLSAYQNYTPAALDLKTESRYVVTEALLKGMGVWWVETYQPAGAPMKMVGSFFDTVDNLVVDPDAEIQSDAEWVARRRVMPYWKLEAKYGLERDSLKPSAIQESLGRQAETVSDPRGDYMRKTGRTNDLVVYWEVFSKMGMGGRLAGAQKDLRDKLEPLGEYVYLVVSERCGYPLQARPETTAGLVSDDPLVAMQAQQECRQTFEWPTPFWADDSWPFKAMAFHWVPRQVWPMSHLRPGMGELKFLNWAYSFLAGKVKNSCRDFIGVLKSAAEDVKETIRTGPDYSIIEVEALHQDIDRVVKFLQHPPFQKDIYEVIEKIAENFEKRTGLTELMYGLSARQMRSAEEAQVKGDQTTIRPDDMANKVEDAMSELARMEAFASRWHLEASDVEPILGPVGAQWWQHLFLEQDPAAILHGLEYRIEAGSSRKPNKSTQVQNANNSMQQLFQPLFQYAMQTGNVGPVNALLESWARANDFDASKFLLQPPAPPPQVAGPPQPGPPMPSPKPPGPRRQNGAPARQPAGVR